MDLVIESKQLLKPLQMISGVVDKKQTMPILSNVLFFIEDPSYLSIIATDLEVELIARIALNVPASVGKITLPARKLIDICRSLPENQEIKISMKEKKVVISAGRSRFSLATLPSEEFPRFEAGQNNAEFSLIQSELRQVIERTYFCMAQQDVRYFLNGLLFELNGGVLRTVATNGHRMAVNALPNQVDDRINLQAILPRKGVLELLRLLAQSDEQISVAVGQKHMQVITNDMTFTSKLIDGRFPDYDKVLPKNGNKKIIIDREIMRQTLSRVAILANEKYRGIRFQLRQNLLKISANNPEQEEAEEDMEIHYTDSDLDTGFNVSYLLDVLASIPQEQVELTLSDPNSSVLIKGVPNDTCAYVIMPMRL